MLSTDSINGTTIALYKLFVNFFSLGTTPQTTETVITPNNHVTMSKAKQLNLKLGFDSYTQASFRKNENTQPP